VQNYFIIGLLSLTYTDFRDTAVKMLREVINMSEMLILRWTQWSSKLTVT